jgi:hypothetical protein
MRTGVLILTFVIAVAFFISASQIIAADAGAQSVSAADRLSIEQSRYSGQWKGDDLTVEYSYSKDQGQMDISGNIRFASFLILGYTRLEDFRLGAIFLDENGRVLKEIGLVANHDAFDLIPFNHRINLPPNAVFMAFSYQGKATGVRRGRTSFWFYPIH